MDEIQKVLIKAGRKDLAVKYYKKVAAEEKKDSKELSKKLDSMEKILMKALELANDITSEAGKVGGYELQSLASFLVDGVEAVVYGNKGVNYIRRQIKN